MGHPEVLPHGVRLLKFKFRVTEDQETTTLMGYSALAHFCGRSLAPTGMMVRTTEINRGTSEEIELSLHLDPLTVEEIENSRGDGDVQVEISLNFLCYRPSGARIFSTGAGVSHEISAKQWLRILAELGHGEVKIIELRRPLLPPHSRLDSAFAHAKKAEEQLRAGENESAVTTCRQAFEAADAVFLKPDAKNPRDKRLDPELAVFIDRDSPGEEGQPMKSERYDALRRALLKLLNTGPHDKYHVSRPDAELCVHMTLALLAFLSRSLKEKEAVGQ